MSAWVHEEVRGRKGGSQSAVLSRQSGEEEDRGRRTEAGKAVGKRRGRKSEIGRAVGKRRGQKSEVGREDRYSSGVNSECPGRHNIFIVIRTPPLPPSSVGTT